MSSIVEIKSNAINQVHGGTNKYTKKFEEAGRNFGEFIGGYMDTVFDITKTYPVHIVATSSTVLVGYYALKKIQLLRNGNVLGGNGGGRSRLLE